jgi:hypothetical protein
MSLSYLAVKQDINQPKVYSDGDSIMEAAEILLNIKIKEKAQVVRFQMK